MFSAHLYAQKETRGKHVVVARGIARVCGLLIVRCTVAILGTSTTTENSSPYFNSTNTW